MCSYKIEAQGFILSYYQKNSFTPWDKVGKEGLALQLGPEKKSYPEA